MTTSTQGRIKEGVLASVIALTVAGCSSGAPIVSPSVLLLPSPSAIAKVSQSAAAVASASPTLTPTPAPSPSRLCSVGSSPCQLSPGVYTTAPSAAAFRFTLPAGWSNDLLDQGGGQVVTPDVVTPDISIFWAVDPHGATADSPGDNVSIGKTTASVVAYLDKLPNTTATPPVDVTIGGLAGRQIDITSTQRNNFLLVAGHVGLGMHATTKARFFVIQKGAIVVVVVVSVDAPTAFDAVVTQTQPIIGSIAWE